MRTSSTIAVVLLLFLTSCRAQDADYSGFPAQCWKLDPSADAKVEAALKRVAKPLKLELESSPSYLLLRDQEGAPRILVMFNPPEFRSTLASYRNRSGQFIDLRRLPELGLDETIATECPEPSSNFSPPVISE